MPCNLLESNQCSRETNIFWGMLSEKRPSVSRVKALRHPMKIICKKSFTFFLLPLRSRGQSTWLQIQRSGFDSWRYQIFWEVVGLEWGPLSLVSTIMELLGRNNSGPSLESREYGRGHPLRRPRDNLHSQKLAPASPTSGGLSAGIVRSRTKATEFIRFLTTCVELHLHSSYVIMAWCIIRQFYILELSIKRINIFV
jgi:hypothetical protein